MSVKCRLLILLIIISISANSQKKSIDSLKGLLGSSNSETDVDIYNQLAEKFRKTDNTLCLSYAKKALELSVLVNYYEGEADAYSQLGQLYFWEEDMDNSSVFERSS